MRSAFFSERSSISQLLLLAWLTPCVASSPHTDALSRLLAAAIARSEGTIVAGGHTLNRPLPTTLVSSSSISCCLAPSQAPPEPAKSFTATLLRHISAPSPLQLRRVALSSHSTLAVARASLSSEATSVRSVVVAPSPPPAFAVHVQSPKALSDWFGRHLRRVLQIRSADEAIALFGEGVAHLLEASASEGCVRIPLLPTDLSLPAARVMLNCIGASPPIDDAIVFLYALCASSPHVSEPGAFRMAEVLLASGVMFIKQTTKCLCACLQSVGKGSTALLFAQWSHAELGLRGLMKELRRAQQRQYFTTARSLPHPTTWQDALSRVGSLRPEKGNGGREWSTQLERALTGQFCDALELALEANAVTALDTLISRFVPAGVSPSRKVVLRVLLNATTGREYEAIRARGLRALWSRASFSDRVRMEEAVLDLCGAPIHLLVSVGEHPAYLPPKGRRLAR